MGQLDRLAHAHGHVTGPRIPRREIEQIATGMARLRTSELAGSPIVEIEPVGGLPGPAAHGRRRHGADERPGTA